MLTVFIVLSALALHPSSAPKTSVGEDSRIDRSLFTSDGWQQATADFALSFPRDHAAHPRYRIEWWYYTGNLETANRRRFGYQLTFFRTGVVREPVNPSRWAIRDLYIAHLAISDIDGASFHSFERINRAGVGWAGADSATYHVWNERWMARLEGRNHILRADESGFGIELSLEPVRPEVIHGVGGISQKGAQQGNASHYYSLTRLKTTGWLTAGNEQFEVAGISWMDHEFGTSFLETAQMGWDWFSIQLDDDRELMLFQIRRTDGSIDIHSSGTLVDAEGNSRHLRFDEFSLRPQSIWRSPTSNAGYPTSWTIVLPGYGLSLSIEAELQDQELRTPDGTGVTYWEGSIRVEGTSGSRPVRGRGYLEMTGYAGQSMGRILN